MFGQLESRCRKVLLNNNNIMYNSYGPALRFIYNYSYILHKYLKPVRQYKSSGKLLSYLHLVLLCA